MASSNSSKHPTRLDQLLSSRGYCPRSRVWHLIRDGIVTSPSLSSLKPESKVVADEIRFEGEALDPSRLILALHKPPGYVCSRADEGRSVYELIPERYACRNPPVSPVGRLDQDTSGLLLLTDDGQLVHRLTSPRHHVPKEYEVTLAEELKGNELQVFASGELLLRGEEKPLLPAKLTVLSPRKALLEIVEGRYHQVKRMFAALDNRVETLRRIRIGSLELGDLVEGAYRIIEEQAVLGASSSLAEQ